ncbi:MAG TPA: glycosyltransferase [Candidatus Eisenbergiella merdipullorum]|uniref:Glycosyltransferase n=1 Tax=Candidatus Eisenbergiella merdipullorum TaxID=2838553 RepID=A0A9D2I6M5_9FIRM|nr:glycosyltransferase [Candidatus Eisenbergiella merdipullorum]
MKDILISYIVPVYNAEKYVEKCVRSIMQQRGADIEIILIDDGSKDSSGHICDLLAEEDSRIQVIHQENRGHGEARNIGIAAARGKWISFVDDDDWLEENTQELCIPYFSEGTDVVLFGKRDIYRNREKEHALKTNCESVEFSDDKDLRALQNSVLDYYYHYNPQFGELTLGVPWGKYIRASLFEGDDCRFVEGYGEDRPCLFLIFFTARKVVYVNKILYNYRIHTSTMRKYLPNAEENYQTAIIKMHEIVGRFLDGHDEPDLQISLYAYDIANFSYFVMQDYCNRDNPKNYKMRKKDFLRDRSNKIFEQAFYRGCMNYLPFRRKCLALMIKYRMFFFINIMSKMNRLFEKVYCTRSD